MKILACLALTLLTACTTVRLEPLALLLGQTEAVATRNRADLSTGKTVRIEGLPEILARATWVDHHVYHKGGYWLCFSTGQAVLLPTGFDIFFLQGAPGHFVIRPEDVAQYRSLVEKIRNSARTAARPPDLFHGANGFIIPDNFSSAKFL